MVNLWPGISTNNLCDKHLNAAINESLNLFVRHHLARSYKINGWVRNGCVDARDITSRICELLFEMKLRDKKWNYDFTDNDKIIICDYFKKWECSEKEFEMMIVAIENNKNKLANRCNACKERIDYNKLEVK
jgi:hypothetical protein